MAKKLDSKTKQNPKLMQYPLKDGRISLYLEYYLGRSETLSLMPMAIRCTTLMALWRVSPNTK